jgi:membrane associated rhomboid family serine protease
MVIPLYDEYPFTFRAPPYVTWALLAANAAIFAIIVSAAESSPIGVFAGMLAFTPSPDIPSPSEAVQTLPWGLTLVTYMFLHANLVHLIGNMLFLWVFGDNVERALGHLRFLGFYLLCGVAGGLGHYASGPGSNVPLIGASGAVAGIIAAYLMLHPCQKVWVLLFARLPLKISAYWALGFWVVMQVINLLVDPQGDISWSAHIGGMLAGALLVIVLRRPGVKLFDCPPTLAPIASDPGPAAR